MTEETLMFETLSELILPENKGKRVEIELKNFVKDEEKSYYNNGFFIHNKTNENIHIHWEEDSMNDEANVYLIDDQGVTRGLFGTYVVDDRYLCGELRFMYY